MYRVRGAGLISMGRDHQVVKVMVAPALPKILLHVLGALRIDCADALFDVGARLQAGPQANDPLAQRRVDKDVIDIRLVLQNALRASAHNHAVALRISLLDNLARDLHRLLGIEDRVFTEFESRRQCGRAHRLLVEPAQP